MAGGNCVRFCALAVLLFVFGAVQADVLQQAVLEYLEPGMQIVDAVQMPLLNGTSAYIIPIDGQETLVIGNWSPKAMEDEGAIQDVLVSGIRKQAGAANAKADLLVIVDGIQAAKIEPDVKCAQYTGTTNHPCVDKDTCNVAAQSSPQAQVMIQADGFWEDMMAWYTMKRDIDISLSQIEAAANSSGESAQYASGMATQIRNTYLKMQELDSNNLLKKGIYGIDRYCPAVPWPYDKLLVAESRWKGISTVLSSLDGTDARAKGIAARAKAWIEYTKTRASDFLKMERDLDGRLDRLSAKLAQYDKAFVDDVGMNDSLAKLRNGTQKAVAAGNAGRFREALASGEKIGDDADALEKRMDGDMQALNFTLRYIDNSRKAQAKLASMGLSAEADDLRMQIAEFEGNLTRMNASLIAQNSAKAKTIESAALEMVAVASLGLEQSDGSAQAAPPKNGSGAQDAGAGQNAAGQGGNASGQIGASGSGQEGAGAAGNGAEGGNGAAPSLPCALPFAIGAGGVGLAYYKAGRRKNNGRCA